jgi:signal transduction histidine kinase
VTVTAKSVVGGRWEIKVVDNGIGIDPQYHHKLFQMFERVHPRYAGTGVGLALVAAIINKLGGSIEVDSDIGGGTTFTFDVEGAWIG